MRQAVTVSLPEKLAEELDTLARREKMSRSDLIRESVRNYLFVRKFRALRSRLMVKAQAQGIYTDQDIFDRVS
jgi:metal-responsive CopG/Arc/MetJ family transcriptional regulator